jgi:uncharacterized membrane protein
MRRMEAHQGSDVQTHGAERGLNRFEGFSDAVFAIALTLLIVEIKVPGSPEGPHGYTDLVRAMAGQWREFLALGLCYVVIGAYWVQHHYSGRIYAKSDHWFDVMNLLFLLAIVVIPYPVRVWCFHLGTGFEQVASVTLVAGLALIACAWMAKWFYGMPGRPGDGQTPRARFPPTDDAPVRHRDAHPDRRDRGCGRGAALRRGGRAAVRRVLPAAAAQAAVQARGGAGRG